MQFIVYQCRARGRLLPRPVRWSRRVVGELIVRELPDPELGRVVRQAEIRAGGAGQLLAGPLLDVELVSAKPDWWTMTGWERVAEGPMSDLVAVQQSWILIPEDQETPASG